MLGIDAAGLLLYGTEGTGNCNCRQSALCIPGDIQVSGQFNAIAVVECNLGMFYKVGFRKGLVPFLCEVQCTHIRVLIAASQQHCRQGQYYCNFHVANVYRDIGIIVLIFAEYIPISQIMLSLQAYNEEYEEGSEG